MVIRDSKDVKYAKHKAQGAPAAKDMAKRANLRKEQTQQSKAGNGGQQGKGGNGGSQHQGKGGNKKH